MSFQCIPHRYTHTHTPKIPRKEHVIIDNQFQNWNENNNKVNYVHYMTLLCMFGILISSLLLSIKLELWKILKVSPALLLFDGQNLEEQLCSLNSKGDVEEVGRQDKGRNVVLCLKRLLYWSIHPRIDIRKIYLL